MKTLHIIDTYLLAKRMVEHGYVVTNESPNRYTIEDWNEWDMDFADEVHGQFNLLQTVLKNMYEIQEGQRPLD